MFSAIISAGTINALVDGKSYTINNDHVNYEQLLDATRSRDEEKFLSLVDVGETIVDNYKGTGIEVKNGNVYHNGTVLHHILVDKILELIRLGYSATPMVNFLDKLMQNPSKTSVDSAYTFLENHGIPLCDDGDFLAYKCVSSNYMDKYSGTFSNKPGTIHEVPRNQVDDRIEHECSYGFHVGGLKYSGPDGWYHNSGDRVMIVKVNPKDIVAVPKDHDCTKMRVCRYEVLEEMTSVLNQPVYNLKEVDEDDFLVGDDIEFDYKGERRFVNIESTNEDHLVGLCTYGDKSDGGYRRFNFNEMSNVIIH